MLVIDAGAVIALLAAITAVVLVWRVSKKRQIVQNYLLAQRDRDKLEALVQDLYEYAAGSVGVNPVSDYYVDEIEQFRRKRKEQVK
jgi:hypothetical protein